MNLAVDGMRTWTSAALHESVKASYVGLSLLLDEAISVSGSDGF